jgi:CelD/BcsL family acetyltransferase involved in cellulose biosynthesis
MTAGRLECDLVEREEEFLALREEWNRLAAAARVSSVFLRHEWFEAAWRWRCEEGALCVLCLRQGGRLVGAVPLLRRARTVRGIPIRVLEFLTVPDTQLCDVIAARDAHEAVAAATFAALRGQVGGWDLLDLDYLPDGSPTLAVLACEAAQHGWAPAVRTPHRNFHIDLAPGWQAFYAGRSRRLKKANNLVANRLRKAFGNIELQWLRAGDLDAVALEQMMETVIAVSASSWKRETGLSLDRRGPGAFIRALAAHAREQGWLSVWLLTLDGRAAAAEFQLIHDGQVYALRADYDEALREHSPGSYLNWKLIEALCESGLARYWMGPGANTYKLHWTEQNEVLHRAMVYGRTPRGRLLGLIERRLRPLAAAARHLFVRPDRGSPEDETSRDAKSPTTGAQS